MISRIDHLVLTVRSLDATCDFYCRVLGFRRLDEPGRPTALLFGNAKFNVHEVDRTFEPKAERPTPGSCDVCLVTDGSVDEIVQRLVTEGVFLEVGPVSRNGAMGPVTSVYFRDPDRNLIEVSAYAQAE